MSVITRTENGTDTLCKFIRSIEALKADPLFDDGDAAIVHDWLRQTHPTPAAQVGRALRELGYDVGTTTIKQHRLKDCGCRVNA